MMRNPDPKPGRWVLPLVVLGMVLFTWVWIDRLGPPEVGRHPAGLDHLGHNHLHDSVR